MASRRILLILALMSALSSGLSAQDGERRVLDFQEDGRSPRWFSVNDTVMGGRSKGGFRIEDGILKFRGTLNTNGGGFASIRTAPEKLGLEGFAGLRLRVRGDGREYSVRLEQRGERGWRKPSYRCTFRTTKAGPEGAWQDVYVAFSDFVPTWRGMRMNRPAIDPARIELVGITLGDKIDGPFALDLKSIDAVRSPAPDSMAGPMLVLSARDAADLQLVRQLVGLGDGARQGARPFTTVVLLSDGPSRVGERALDRAAVQALRARLGVRGNGFQAVLVADDGSVALRSTRPLSAKQWVERLPGPDAEPESRIGVR